MSALNVNRPARRSLSRSEADRLGWRFTVVLGGLWRASKDVDEFGPDGRAHRSEFVLKGTMGEVLAQIDGREGAR